jgi:hypothetical protein
MFSTMMKLSTLVLSAALALPSANAAAEACFGQTHNTTFLDFYHSTVTESTLHLPGGKLRFEDIGIVRDRSVDLVVTIVEGTTYTTSNADKNGKYVTKDDPEPKFGNINLVTKRNDLDSGQGNFRFCLVDHETDVETVAESFRWSVYDIDERHAAENGIKEKFTMDVTQAVNYFLYPDDDTSEIQVSCEDNPGGDLPCDSGRTIFHSSTRGVGSDNPDDPNDLTEQQKERSIVFAFKDTACWEFTYDHYCKLEEETGGKCRWYGGGNFLFAGDAHQVVDEGTCTVASTLAPTSSPTGSPTQEPTAGLIKNGDDEGNDDFFFPPPDCPTDIELVKTNGVTEFPPIDRSPITIVSQDTDTVTVALNQVWDTRESIDAIYYQFKPSVFDSKCYKEPDVILNDTYDTITIQCSQMVALAHLEICLVDAPEHGFLTLEDNATVPQCCHADDPDGTPTVCYIISIDCTPGCETTSQESARSLRGVSN